jgi:hypothetical protein
MNNKCENKINLNCPPNSPFANCVRSEITPPEFSGLTSSCNSAEELFENLYEVIGGIKEEIDLSSLENGCITFTLPKTPLSVITQMYNKICELEVLVIGQGETIATHMSQIENLQNETCP